MRTNRTLLPRDATGGRPTLVSISLDLTSTCSGDKAPLRTEKKYMLPLKNASWAPQLLRPRYVFSSLYVMGTPRVPEISPARRPLTHHLRIPSAPCGVYLMRSDAVVWF